MVNFYLGERMLWNPPIPKLVLRGVRGFNSRKILKFYLICRSLVLVHLKTVFNMFLLKGFAIKNENAGDFFALQYTSSRAFSFSSN